jgi:hypothetical protein
MNAEEQNAALKAQLRELQAQLAAAEEAPLDRCMRTGTDAYGRPATWSDATIRSHPGSREGGDGVWRPTAAEVERGRQVEAILAKDKPVEQSREDRYRELEEQRYRRALRYAAARGSVGASRAAGGV